MPCPNGVDVAKLLEKYIANLEIPVQVTETEFVFGEVRHRTIANELIGANEKTKFSPEIYVKWLKKIVIWWENDKKYLEHIDKMVVVKFRAQFSDLTRIMSLFILPNFKVI